MKKLKTKKTKFTSSKSKMKPKKSNPTGMGKWTLSSLGKLLLVFSILVPSAALAQTVNLPVPIPSTTKVEWIHDGKNTDKYQFLVDAANYIDIAQFEKSADSYSADFPAISPGQHTITVCAVNIAGRTCAVDSVTVNLVVVPTAPSGITIIIR